MDHRYVTQLNPKSKLNLIKASMNRLRCLLCTPMISLKFILTFALLGLVSFAESDPSQSPVAASLLADTSAILPGQPFMVGVLLRAQPGWHTYGRDPGDSGFPTSIVWNLPPGFHAGEIQWPTPIQKKESGDLKVNVYEGELLLLVQIIPPKNPGADIVPDVKAAGNVIPTVRLRAQVKWLACNDSCIPGMAEIAMTLPVASTAAPANKELFEKYRALMPEVERTPDRIQKAPAPHANAVHDLFKYLCFAFLGGVILNLMPCVLPVIAIKIYGFIQQSGQSRRRILELGLAYCAGVFAWFLGLATLVAFFGLNWSFQFQSKPFVLAMLLICLIFGLNLLGLFELILSGSLTNKLAGLASKEGLAGAFVHGLFATLLGSACTAPLLGPAIGFALAQPAPVVFGIFSAIAAGMALPYFLLTLNPTWLRYLPRPGVWMVRVKQVMGVIVLATAVWFGFILFHQISARPDHFAQTLETALKSDRIVFVDFTAEWCINCKVNEKRVLESEAVRRVFKEKNVDVLKADWTTGNPEITQLLKQFGRAGVPLYVIYPADRSVEPIVLPELLTQQMVLDGLAKAGW